MATLSITVPDALVPQVVAAFRFRYPDLTGDVPGQTPLTDAQAARKVIRKLVIDQVTDHAGVLVRQTQTNQVDAARQQAATDMAVIS